MTCREAAEHLERDEARNRRRAQFDAEIQLQNDTDYVKYTAEVSQHQDAVASEWLKLRVIY